MRLPYIASVVLCIVSAITARGSSLEAADSDPQLTGTGQLLLAPSFRLIARIRGLRMDTGLVGFGEFKSEITSNEFYSNEQLRARLEIHSTRKNPFTGQSSVQRPFYYYDSQNLIRQEFTTSEQRTSARQAGTKLPSSRCVLSDTKQLTANLLHAVLGVHGREIGVDWHRKLEGIPDHVVGAARLLFIVDSRRSFLERIPETNTIKIRNHAAVSYTLSKGLTEIAPTIRKLRVSYPKTSDHSIETDLPLRIVITLTSADQIVVDYSSVGSLTGSVRADESALDYSSDALDMFALPAGINCSAVISNQEGVQLTSDRSLEASFQAEIFRIDNDGLTKSLSKRFIAYDSPSSLLRSDLLAADGSSSTTTILDISLGIKHNILWDFESDTRKSTARCVSARFANRAEHFPFLQFNELLPIGNSTVKGISCVAFEQISSRLPVNIFPQMDARELITSASNSRTSEKRPAEADYNIIYHFAAHSEAPRPIASLNGRPLGGLMRVDVFQAGKFRFHVQVLDFLYALAEAPNGDRAEELFSLRDRCTSGRQGSDSYASISMKLVADESKAQAASKDQQVSLEEVATSLASSVARNSALMKAFAQWTFGVVKNIYDLESQVKIRGNSRSKLDIYVGARLSLADTGLARARLVGFVNPTAARVEYETAEDCFFRAAHHATSNSPSGVTLFASCFNWCNYDPDPDFSFSAGGELVSGLFAGVWSFEREPKGIYSCPLLLLEQEKDSDLEERLKKQLYATFRHVYLSLHDMRLGLLVPRPESGEPFRVGLQVEELEISNDRWSVEQAFERAERRAGGQFIAGIGLTKASGGQAQEKADDEIQDEMDYERCHSLCMAWMRCQSFSVCATSRGAECITSEISFRDDKLMKSIDAATLELKTNTDARKRAKTIKIPYAGQDKEDTTESTPSGEIELRVDFRCRLYKKNVLDLFQKLRPVVIRIRQKSTLRSVDSLMKCAELCTRNNMIFFQNLEKTETKLIDGKLDKGDENVLGNIRKDYEKIKRTWCAGFSYLNLATSSAAEQLKSFLDPQKLSKQGLCKLNTVESSRVESDSETKDARKIRFEAYGFRYTDLYKATYGIQLRPSSELAEKAVIENEVTVVQVTDIELCASKCFLQTEALEQGCRSFDFVQLPGSQAHWCALNSVSLNEIKANNLSNLMVVDRTLPDDSGQKQHVGPHKCWHYEPRSFSIANAVVAAKSLASEQRSLNQQLTGIRLHGFGIFLVVLVALICSLLATNRFASAVIERTSGLSGSQQRRVSLRNILESFTGAPAGSNQSGGSSRNGGAHSIAIEDLDIANS